MNISNDATTSPIATREQLYELAELPMFIYAEPEDRVIDCNRSMQALLGTGSAHSWADAFPGLNEELRKFCTNASYRVTRLFTLPGGKGLRFLMQHTTAGGGKKLVVCTGLPEAREDATLESVYNLIRQAPVGMGLFMGEELVTEIVNARFLEIWGRSEEEVIGKPAYSVSPEAAEQGFKALMLNVMATGESFVANEQYVELYRGGKLTSFYVNFVYEPFRNHEGKVVGLIMVVIDVTEMVRARQAITIAEERARQAIESAALGSYLLHYRTQELEASDQFFEIWGMSPEAVREDYVAVLHPDDLASRDEAHHQALKTGVLNYEARFKKNDEWRWMRANGKVLFDEDGNPEYLVGVVQDITDQKNFADALAREVEERTQELKTTNEALARTNEELEQFAYIASHDLQEPLRKISLFSKMVLEKHQAQPESKLYLEKVVNASNRMTGLIKNLLDYSKLSQKLVLFEPVSLAETVNAVLQDLEVPIAQKGAEVVVKDLPTIKAIPLQMSQLFLNLINNALKFSRKGVKPKIEITGEKLSGEEVASLFGTEQKKDYFRVTVRDNGIGFNQDYADKIFTIFQRLNENALYGGYGIGLALCRKVVANHNGLISATGNPGEGASFNIILPAQP